MECRDKGERETGGSTVQASVLMNSQFVKSRIHPTPANRLGELLAHEPPLPNEQIVEEMFLAFLSRFPEPGEKTAGVEVLQQFHAQGLEDLAWSLINKPEFIVNH